VWEPPERLSNPVDHSPPRRLEFITNLRVAAVTVILEHTRLATVQSQIGGAIGRRGDASQALAWLCVHGRDARGVWALWLEAGEIHGGTVGAFQLRRLDSHSRFDGRCQSVAGSSAVLADGVRLGLSGAQITRILGRPASAAGDTWLYTYEHPQVVRGEPFTTSSTLIIRFHNAILDAVDFWKATIS